MTQQNRRALSIQEPLRRAVPSIERRRLLGAALAGGLGFAGAGTLAGCSVMAPAGTQTPREPTFTIRNAVVVSMDRSVGDFAAADVVIRDGVIEAVGPGAASGRNGPVIDGSGMIVMPGFVETHWHLWSSVTRNMLRDGVEYFPLKNALMPHFTPADYSIGNRLGLAEAAAAGLTTVNNFAHSTRTQAHVDAELAAMAASGLRGRYSYGNRDPMPSEEVMPIDDVLRVQREWFGPTSPKAGALLQLGVAPRGPALSTPTVYAIEYRAALAAKLPVVVHTGQSRFAYVSAAKLLADGLIAADTILVHALMQTEADRAAIRAVGASVSFAPQSELRLQGEGDFRAQLLHMKAEGINVCLSLDATTLASVSMFDQMSTVWYLGAPWRGTSTEKLARISFRDCLEMATINGARALGIADRVGSLTPGKRADLLMIRATDLNMVPAGNVFSALVRAATVANIDSVVVDGHFVKHGGQLVGIDTAALAREAAASLYQIRSRAGGVWAPESAAPGTY